MGNRELLLLKRMNLKSYSNLFCESPKTFCSLAGQTKLVGTGNNFKAQIAIFFSFMLFNFFNSIFFLLSIKKHSKIGYFSKIAEIFGTTRKWFFVGQNRLNEFSCLFFPIYLIYDCACNMIFLSSLPPCGASRRIQNIS